jgi:hypothetical protein
MMARRVTRGTAAATVGKALIVLQENSGHIPLPDGTPQVLKDAITGVVDKVAETFEDVKTKLQGAGKYDVVVLLTDKLCTRPHLVNALVDQAKRGRPTDLMVLGHGSSESLVLNKGKLTGGAGGNIRSLPADCRAKGAASLTLRMVYMCNCYGGTLNDDWVAAGAKASVGSKMNDYMPEPMTTFFLHHWMNGQKVKDAARNAYQQTIPFYALIYPPTIKPKFKKVSFKYPCPTWNDPFRLCNGTQDVPNGFDTIQNGKITETELVVGGNGNLTF